MPRTMRLLNSDGDTTIGWTEDQDAKIKAWVEARLNEGYTFFIINNSGQELRMRKFDEAVSSGRRIVLGTKDSDDLLWEAAVYLVTHEDDGTEVETHGRARTAAEVVSNDTIAVRPAAGG